MIPKKFLFAFFPQVLGDVSPIDVGYFWANKGNGTFSNDNQRWTTVLGSGSASWCRSANTGVYNLNGRKVYVEIGVPTRDGTIRAAMGVAASEDTGFAGAANVWHAFSAGAAGTCTGTIPQHGTSTGGTLASDSSYAALTTSVRWCLAADMSASPGRKLWFGYITGGSVRTWINGDPAADTGGMSFSSSAGAHYVLAATHTCSTASGTLVMDIYGAAAQQQMAPPTGFSRFQP